jgi:hypothetical protein
MAKESAPLRYLVLRKLASSCSLPLSLSVKSHGRSREHSGRRNWALLRLHWSAAGTRMRTTRTPPAGVLSSHFQGRPARRSVWKRLCNLRRQGGRTAPLSPPASLSWGCQWPWRLGPRRPRAEQHPRPTPGGHAQCGRTAGRPVARPPGALAPSLGCQVDQSEHRPRCHLSV